MLWPLPVSYENLRAYMANLCDLRRATSGGGPILGFRVLGHLRPPLRSSPNAFSGVVLCHIYAHKHGFNGNMPTKCAALKLECIGANYVSSASQQHETEEGHQSGPYSSGDDGK